MQSLCTLRNRCRQRPRNTRYQADATPYLGRTSTGWIAPALPGALMLSPLSRPDLSKSRSCAAPGMRMAGRDRQPCAPIARKQAIGGGGPGAAGGIIGEIVGRSACPGIEEPLYGAPSRLDRIGPLEQGGVAYETIVD